METEKDERESKRRVRGRKMGKRESEVRNKWRERGREGSEEIHKLSERVLQFIFGNVHYLGKEKRNPESWT